MIAVWILLETGNQIIHQALGRNFHTPPGDIAIGEIITLLVIGFLGDLALPQRVGRQSSTNPTTTERKLWFSGAWGAEPSTSFLQNVLTLHCLQLQGFGLHQLLFAQSINPCQYIGEPLLVPERW